MPCLPLAEKATDGKRHRVGFVCVCVGNEPVTIQHNGRKHLFEWHAACGWMPTNKDGSERLSRVPKAVWDAIERIERPES